MPSVSFKAAIFLLSMNFALVKRLKLKNIAIGVLISENNVKLRI
jgi:hypothetical protein